MSPVNVADALYWTKEVNNSYRERTGEDGDWTSLTNFLNAYLETEGYDFKDVARLQIEKMEETNEPKNKKGDTK